MAYNYGAQHNNSQPQYGQYQDGYVETPAGGYNAQYGANNAAQHTQFPDASNYGGYNPGSGPVQQHQANYADSIQSPRSPTYGYSQQYTGAGAPASSGAPAYNPQQYAPAVPQYNPQAYGSNVNRTYTNSTQSYNPAAYAQPGAQQAYGYSPGSLSSTFSSPQPNSYGQPSPGLSQQQFQPQYAHSYSAPQVPFHSQQYQYSTSPSYHTPSFAQTVPPAQPSYATTGSASPYLHQEWQSSPPPPPPPRRESSISASHPSYTSISPALPGLADDPGLPSPPSSHLPSPPTYGSFNQAQYAPYPPPVNDHQPPSPLYSSGLPSPPGPTPPAHGSLLSRTDTSGRHPRARPLPGPPVAEPEPDYFPRGNGFEYDDYYDERQATEDLFSQVEDAVMNAGNASTARRRSPHMEVNGGALNLNEIPEHLFSPNRGDSRRSSNKVNGHLSPDHARTSIAGNGYGSDSDPEGAAGLAMMELADARDAEEARRQSGGSGLFLNHGSQRSSRQQPIAEYSGEDSDMPPVDLDAASGGHGFNISYGGDPSQLAAGGAVNGTSRYSQPISSSNSLRRSQASSQGDSFDYATDAIHPFPPFATAARVDAGGTGGLSEPSAHNRRQSYDEGDEYALMEEPLAGSGPQELFFHPEPSLSRRQSRPLPPPPPHSDGQIPQLNTGWRSPSTPQAKPPYPLDPNAFVPSTTNPGQWVPRSTSLLSHSTTPQINYPNRSKTDAERRQMAYRSSVYSTFDSTPATSAVGLDLPSLPTKRFNPAKLGANDFKRCEEPWALSSLLAWLRQVADPDQVTELKESMVKEAFVALFTNKVPTMNIADAEILSNRVVEDMYAAGTLIVTEEWVKLGPGDMTGVIFQLTQMGCYSPTLHDHIMPGRCYSRHCQRTLRKVNLQATPVRTSEDWATFYKLKKEDVEGVEKMEIERQNILHEIVQTEDHYMEQLNVLRLLYRDPLANIEPSIISPKRREKFLREVFGKVDAVKKANEDHLLPQLKYRQEEQGPWIKGFSDIFRQWIRKAKTAYIEYAAGFPSATMLMRQETERNLEFYKFVDRQRKNHLSNKLGWDTYLKAPITRLQRYTLLLATVHKNMKEGSEEKTNLQTAINEVKAVTLECDARVAEMDRKVVLADLAQKLRLRPGMEGEVELNLNHLGRELVFKGDLQRTGANRFNWVECHALLFDHYLVLAKAIAVQQKGSTGKVEKYDVSRLPIPMDLLVLESTNDDAVVKSSYVKGLTTSVSTVTTRSPATPDAKLGRTTSNQSGPPPLIHANTASSVNLASTTVLGDAKDSDKIMFPFRIKHLGREPYVLFAPTSQNRAEWCNKIIEAKTKHAASLFAQNAEPFRLRVMADSAFYYDTFSGSGGKDVVIQRTPLDRAIKEVEHRFKDTGRPAPICRARVNCATSFTTPYPGKHMVAVGTDYGVYVSEIDNPRGWLKAINIPRVTQVAVLEEFSLVLLIADKALIAYHLDVVYPSDHVGAPAGDTARKAPQKLSGSRDVGFFAVGRMKDRTLVFYKKRDGISSTFKVLEPVFQKSTEKKRGMFKRGATEFFREYDEFYIPTECSGINLFHNSLAVSTSKGFEVLTLDKKQPWSVPDLKAPEVGGIAAVITDQNTLGMLRLSDQEFLLCYEKCAVYVNKHGDVSRSVIMNFVGKAKSAALYGAYLVLFDNDFVEIRNAQNGRLKQIIAGREIKCLDDGGGGTVSGGTTNGGGVVNGVPGLGAGGRTVKIVMQHPELERTQIVVELLLNEGIRE